MPNDPSPPVLDHELDLVLSPGETLGKQRDRLTAEIDTTARHLERNRHEVARLEERERLPAPPSPTSMSPCSAEGRAVWHGGLTWWRIQPRSILPGVSARVKKGRGDLKVFAIGIPSCATPLWRSARTYSATGQADFARWSVPRDAGANRRRLQSEQCRSSIEGRPESRAIPRFRAPRDDAYASTWPVVRAQFARRSGEAIA